MLNRHRLAIKLFNFFPKRISGVFKLSPTAYAGFYKDANHARDRFLELFT